MSRSNFNAAIRRQNFNRPPIWFMRQAGRYHSHYQNLRKRYSFLDLCQIPEISAQAALGPIEDFDFDAAILFSDILFTLRALGMEIDFEPGPKFRWLVRAEEDLKRLRLPKNPAEEFRFQAQALTELRSRLNPDKALIGFVGGPLTLFSFALYGTHKTEIPRNLSEMLGTKTYFTVMELLMPVLKENILIQARENVDLFAILDSCAGDVPVEKYREWVAPALRELIADIKRSRPQTPLLYYGKNTTPQYWETLKTCAFDGLGVDWKVNLAEVLEQFGDRWAIQGNFDPSSFFGDEKDYIAKRDAFFEPLVKLPASRRAGWICGLGHGILPQTPEHRVRDFIQREKELWG